MTKKIHNDIRIMARNNGKIVTVIKTTSISRMWIENKALFKRMPNAELHIRKDGEVFLKLHLVEKKSGKKWMEQF